MERKSASQQQKYVAFKTAFENIAAFRKKRNFIGAYVVAFSVIEDRLRAMFVVRYIAENGTQPNDKKINGGFSDIVKLSVKKGDISNELGARLLEEAKIRNKLLHAAMWKLNAFSAESVEQVLLLVREIDNCRRIQKRNIKDFVPERISADD